MNKSEAFVTAVQVFDLPRTFGFVPAQLEFIGMTVRYNFQRGWALMYDYR